MIKKEYHHGNLREEFLKIAFDFIAKEDIDKLTLKVLSDATGTSRSAIYKHFKSKDALVEEIIEIGFLKFDKSTSPILMDKQMPLIDRFYKSGKLYIEFAKENPNLYRLLFGKKYAHIRDEIISIKEDDCSGFGALKVAIQEGHNSGILKKDSSHKQTIVIWSSLHGLSSLIIDGFMDVEELYEELYDDMFETLLAGIIANKVKLLSSLPFAKRILKPTDI
jgi:AcrR family transcriptional regulator